MTNEHSGISRRKLLRTTAIAVPTASVLAFGSTLVTAPAANALKQVGARDVSGSAAFHEPPFPRG